MLVRYPRKFEIYRLQAMGDPPYLDEDEAHITYLDGQALTVTPSELSGAGKPAWHLQTGAGGSRFSWTFYSELGTPLRDVKWEKQSDALVLRSTKDLFYPEGDPGRRVPYAQIVSVTREYSTDGVVMVVVETPGKPAGSRKSVAVPADALSMPVPEFGEWEDLLRRSMPEDLDRFGPGARAAAKAYAEAAPIMGAARLPVQHDGDTGGWSTSQTGPEVVDQVVALVHGDAPELEVLDRGAARIIPLAVQAPLASDRDPAEEVRRMKSLAKSVDMELEHRHGRGTNLGFNERHGSDCIDAYVDSLRQAGATDARSWSLGADATAAVLVWSGDQAAGTRTLALHVVPASWTSDRHEGPPTRVDLSWGADSLEATKEKDA